MKIGRRLSIWWGMEESPSINLATFYAAFIFLIFFNVYFVSLYIFFFLGGGGQGKLWMMHKSFLLLNRCCQYEDMKYMFGAYPCFSAREKSSTSRNKILGID